MLLAFQASAFDRSATCPDPMCPRNQWTSRGAHHNCYCGFGGSAFGGAGVALGAAVLVVEKGGGMSRQGSSLPRIRSGVFNGGTLSAFRVLGASRPGGACNGGNS